jgi:hypothetical protein
VPIRHTAAGEVAAALQEARITVFLAGDDDALAVATGRYLGAAGFLRHADDVRVEATAAPPSESLDPDAIWTGAAPIDTSSSNTRTEDQEVASR